MLVPLALHKETESERERETGIYGIGREKGGLSSLVSQQQLLQGERERERQQHTHTHKWPTHVNGGNAARRRILANGHYYAWVEAARGASATQHKTLCVGKYIVSSLLVFTAAAIPLSLSLSLYIPPLGRHLSLSLLLIFAPPPATPPGDLLLLAPRAKEREREREGTRGKVLADIYPNVEAGL